MAFVGTWIRVVKGVLTTTLGLMDWEVKASGLGRNEGSNE